MNAAQTFVDGIRWTDYAGATIASAFQPLDHSWRNVITRVVLRDRPPASDWETALELDGLTLLRCWIPIHEVRSALSELHAGRLVLARGTLELMNLNHDVHAPQVPYSWHATPINTATKSGAWPSETLLGTGSLVSLFLRGRAEVERLRRQLGPVSDGRLASWRDVAEFLEHHEPSFIEHLSSIWLNVPTYARIARIDDVHTFVAEVSARISPQSVRLSVARRGLAAAEHPTPAVVDERYELTFKATGNAPMPADSFQLAVRGETVHEGNVADVVGGNSGSVSDQEEGGSVDVVVDGATPTAPPIAVFWTIDISFIVDQKLRAVLDRNLRELAVAQTMGLHTAAIVLAGAIGEGVLFDALAHRKAAAMSAPSAPKSWRTKQVKDVETENWSLVEYIKVAKEIGVLAQTTARMADDVLREFRNMIHPKVQLTKGLVPDDAEMKGSMAWLEAVARDVRKAP